MWNISRLVLYSSLVLSAHEAPMATKMQARAAFEMLGADITKSAKMWYTVHFLITYTLGSHLAPIHYKKYTVAKCSHSDRSWLIRKWLRASIHYNENTANSISCIYVVWFALHSLCPHITVGHGRHEHEKENQGRHLHLPVKYIWLLTSDTTPSALPL